MKFTAILILATCLSPGVNGYSQETLSERKTPLQKVFNQSRSQTGNEIETERQTGAVAQQPITGRVTDEEGSPIAGVSVLVKGTKKGSITDDNGNFSIEAIIGDALVFSSVSYGTKEIKITNASICIKLSLQIKPLEELVVSGNVVAVKRKADVSSVTVLTGKEIAALPGFNLVNILEGVVPGVTITSMGTSLFRTGEYFNSRIQVRGADIKVYVDGIVYAAGSSYLAMINKDDIDRIEVVRGPSAATLYGSGAIGGVMLIYTKKGSSDKTAINITTSAGFQQSDYTEKHKQFQQKHSAEFSQGIKNFSYVIGGNYRTQDDYLPKGSLKAGGVYANFSYTISKFKFVLSNNYNINSIISSTYPMFDTITGVGDFFESYKDSGYVKDNYRIHSGGVSLNTSFQAASWWTHNLVVGYSENNYHYLTDISLYTDTTLINYYGGALGAQQWTSKDKTPTINYNNVIKIGNLHDPFKMNIVSGFEYSNTKHDEIIHNQELHYTTAGGFTYIPNVITGAPFYNYKREYTGAFLQLSPVFKEKYFLIAGARYEKSNVSIAVVNPRIGFTTNFELSNLIIKPRINWGRSVTPPPYYITHPGPPFGLITFIANPDIKPKEQGGVDVAIEIYDKKDKFKMELVHYDNIIRNDFTRTSIVDGAGAIISYVNIGKYAHKGWEFSSDYKINKFKIGANYSIINATYIDSFAGRKTFYKGDRVDYIPNYAAGASLNYTIPKLLGKSDRLSATLSMTSSGKMITSDSYQYLIDLARWQAGNGPDPSSNDYIFETPAVTKYNLNIDYQFHPNLGFFIQAQNFTNNTTPDWDKTFPVSGASWMFGLNLNFHKMTK
jgi:outer membrane receptor protein involved in Fe transport